MKKDKGFTQHHFGANNTPKKMRQSDAGFTLIEVIIYIALFTILIGTAFVTVFELIDGSNKLNQKNTTEEEGNFVMRKINWALTGISNDTSDIASPSIFYPYATSNTLSIKKWWMGSEISVDLRLNVASSSIEMREGTNDFLPISTINVKVTNLSFGFIPASGNGPAGIIATTTINGIDFVLTKYIRK